MFQVMHKQMYGSAKRRREETFWLGMPPFPLLNIRLYLKDL